MNEVDSIIAEQAGFAYFCPDNNTNTKLTLLYLCEKVDVDWALLFIGVGGGYLDHEDIFSYALSILDDHSDERVLDLTLCGYEDDPDPDFYIPIIRSLAADIDVQTWALAFIKLLYALVYWLYGNSEIDDELKEKFAILSADFYYLRSIHRLVYYMPPRNDIHIKGAEANDWLLLEGAISLYEMGTKLDRLDFHDRRYQDDLYHIMECWRTARYYEGYIPEKVDDLRKRLPEPKDRSSKFTRMIHKELFWKTRFKILYRRSIRHLEPDLRERFKGKVFKFWRQRSVIPLDELIDQDM